MAVDLGDHAILLLEDAGKLGTESIYIEQIRHADSNARMFVHISWGDAALRSADLICSPRFFLEAIK